jgi:hypothetical protein
MASFVDIPVNFSSFRIPSCDLIASLLSVSLRVLTCYDAHHKNRISAASNPLSSVLLRVRVSLPYIRHGNVVVL